MGITDPARRQFSVRGFRRLVQVSLLLSVALVVLGIWGALQGQWWLAVPAFIAGVLFLLPPQFVRIRPVPGSETLLVLVVKKECALCDEARLLLPSLLEGTPFHVEEADLESDRFLRRHFRNDVPVLLWQGEVLATLRFDPESLRTKLRELAPGPAPPAK